MTVQNTLAKGSMKNGQVKIRQISPSCTAGVNQKFDEIDREGPSINQMNSEK